MAIRAFMFRGGANRHDSKFGGYRGIFQKTDIDFLVDLENLTNSGMLDEQQQESIRKAAWRRVGFDA